MDYAIELQPLSADSGWNDSALIDAFLHGLAARVKDDLDGLIDLSNKIDRRLREREVFTLTEPSHPGA